jgi:hypothetical protein
VKFGQIALAASLSLVLLGSVAAKISQLNVLSTITRQGTDERTVAFLRDHGFVPTGTVFLSRDGGYRAFSFERDGCSGAVYVSVAPINGGTLEMLYLFAGNSSRILFGYNGEIYDEPPIVRAYLTWKFWDLLFALKLTTALPQTDFLVIIAPMCCEAINTLPWQNI